MKKEKLIEQIRQKESFLCIGLDTDATLIPKSLGKGPEAMLAFNKAMIDATLDLCVSYKINTAFYEAMGSEGWKVMEKTVAHIPESHFRIADAKRGDIGNTTQQYARAFFETMNFDAVTLHPYMGRDSIEPFLNHPDKWAIILALTSNPSAEDFETMELRHQEGRLYEQVIQKSATWGNTGNTMFVTGATRAEELTHIRKLAPDHFLLVPGVGTQGGSLEDVWKYGSNKECGLLVNVSRAIIYAGNDSDFAEKGRSAAQGYQTNMQSLLRHQA
jgi:orotidine-5'-phosphate decarboxylase